MESVGSVRTGSGISKALTMRIKEHPKDVGKGTPRHLHPMYGYSLQPKPGVHCAATGHLPAVPTEDCHHAGQ